MAISWSRTRDIITIDVDDVTSATELWLLLRSDAHHDSAQCDRKLEKKHLELAKEREALILDFGDLFDCMQTRTDPRRAHNDMKAEYISDSYLNAITAEAAKFYAPYAPMWVLMGEGNHEQAIAKYSDYNVTSGLISLLNSKGSSIIQGGYDGYVKVRFSGRRSESMLLYYTHGSGGSARRSKGILKADLRAAVHPDADVIVSGHIHSSWQHPQVKERVTNAGVIWHDLMWHLQLPSYKRPGAWETSKEMSANPMGAHWLHITVGGDAGNGSKRMHIEPRWGID